MGLHLPGTLSLTDIWEIASLDLRLTQNVSLLKLTRQLALLIFHFIILKTIFSASIWLILIVVTFLPTWIGFTESGSLARSLELPLLGEALESRRLLVLGNFFPFLKHKPQLLHFVHLSKGLRRYLWWRRLLLNYWSSNTFLGGNSSAFLALACTFRVIVNLVSLEGRGNSLKSGGNLCLIGPNRASWVWIFRDLLGCCIVQQWTLISIILHGINGNYYLMTAWFN